MKSRRVSLIGLTRKTFVKNSSRLCNNNFSLAKIKHQKRRRREENLINLSFSKREKRDLVFLRFILVRYSREENVY